MPQEQDAFSKGRAKLNADRKEEAVRRKALFLAAYEEYGTVLQACKLADIPRQTFLNWNSTDHDFAKELDQKKQSFGENLEGIALERVRNPDKNRGSDVLLLGLLNANMPAKYRPQIAMSEDAAKDLIFEWRKASKEVQKQKDDDLSGLPVQVEDTLQEILERRGKAPLEKHEEKQNSETEEEDAPKGTES
jgi:molybdenum-dependent DNA-binding transcriptional regulator ModE